MRELDELIYSRIKDDPWLLYWLTASGAPGQSVKPNPANPNPPGNAYGLKKIKHGHQKNVKDVPALNFYLFQMLPGLLRGNHTRTYEAIYEFGAFASTYYELTSRIKLLFDGWCFNVPSSYTEVGKVSSVFDWEGSEGFDETLKENFRFVRIRFLVTSKPNVPS